MTDAGLLRGPLHDLHVSAGAVLAIDAGWEMPARYGEAAAEVKSARESAVVCDVSHWGRIRVRGEGAMDLLRRLGGEEILRQEDDTVRPIVLPGATSPARLVRLEGFWVVLTEPRDRLAALASLRAAAGGEAASSVDDQTEQTAMLACLGPRAAERLDAVLPIRVSDLADGAARAGSLLVARYIACRSDLRGASGEGPARLWRLEVMLPPMWAGKAWRFLTEKAGESRFAPVGTEAMAALLGGALKAVP